LSVAVNCRDSSRLLTTTQIPASVEVIGSRCFADCKSLRAVTFDVDCKLSRLEQYAFSWNAFTAIHIPASVEVICENCFSEGGFLRSVAFAVDCKLSRLEQDCFLAIYLLQFTSPHPLK
jgi:hypothetical protein